MGDNLNPGTLNQTACGGATPVINYEQETIDFANACYQNGSPLTIAQKMAYNEVVLLAKQNAPIGTTQILPLPIITLDSTGVIYRTELIGASFIAMAILQGIPLNTSTGNGSNPDIVLDPVAGTATLKNTAGWGVGQTIFIGYVKETDTPAKRVFALPVLTLNGSSILHRQELIGASEIILALLENTPINVIVDSGQPDILLDANAGNLILNITTSANQRLFINYTK